MTTNIDTARDFLNKLNGVSDEEMTMKKIRMVLIRQYLQDTKNQLKQKEKLCLDNNHALN